MDLGAGTIRGDWRQSTTRTRKARESNDIEQRRDSFCDGTRRRVEVTPRFHSKFTVREGSVMLGIHQRVESGDIEVGTVIFHGRREHRRCIQRGQGLDICAFIDTRRSQTPVRVFNCQIRDVLSHNWTFCLRRYIISCRLGHLKDVCEYYGDPQGSTRTGMWLLSVPSALLIHTVSETA